jgi:SAM-dependent methyltransferase
MTSGHHENGMNPESKPARQHHERTQPASSESAYEWLSAYGFARHYAKGKTVADLSHQEAGYGSLLLAQSAQSVTALSDLPKLPLPEGRFDVVVAFGVIESLENAQDLVRKAKGVLKEEGVLLVSAPDKRADATNYRAGVDGRRGMYVPELRGLLERHFGHVRLYHQGAVAGGFVFPVSEELTDGGMPVESVRLSSSGPRFGAEPPTTRSVMAVCSDEAEALGREERAYLLLDRDRGVFAESEERAEDVELMRDEIRRMQETEVQAFLNAMSAQQLPLGVLLRLIPQVFLYYLYTWSADLQEVRHRRRTVLAKVRHHWETILAMTRHRRDATLAQVRHHRDVTLAEARHGRVAVIEEARRRRNLALGEARHRRNLALDEARHRRNLALEDTRHRRNLILAEMRHRRNVALERIIHWRNIILGNMQALRQKDAKGLAKGAFRRLSALYQWLRERQKP